MKKRIALLVAVTLLAGALTGCGKEAEFVKDIKASDYVTLGTYKGVEVTVEEPAAVAEASVKDYMEYLASLNTTKVEVTDRSVVEDGDTVNIDYTGYRDGVAFDNGAAKGQDLTIGSGRFIPGFEDGLIGKEVGETVMLDLKFPEDYTSTEMAGAEVTFEVTINSISILEQQEMTVDFLKEKTQVDCGSIEEFQDYMYDMFYEDAVNANEEEIAGSIAQTVMANSIFEEPPEKMVERYCNMQVEDLTAQLAVYGTDLNTYMQTYYGMDSETYMAVFMEDAAKMAQQYIMFQAIADAEGLNLTEEEIAQAMQEQVDTYGYESVEDFKEQIGEDVFYEYLMAEKVMDFLKENAVIEER